MVPPASHKVSRVSWYSGTQPNLCPFAYEALTLFGLTFQLIQLGLQYFCRARNTRTVVSKRVTGYSGFRWFPFVFLCFLSPVDCQLLEFGLFPFRSPLLRESRLITLPPVT